MGTLAKSKSEVRWVMRREQEESTGIRRYQVVGATLRGIQDGRIVMKVKWPSRREDLGRRAWYINTSLQ
jgi:hypothetical protein